LQAVVLVCLLLSAAQGCGPGKKPGTLRPASKSRIERWAGRLAAHLSVDGSPLPDSSEMEAFISFCDDSPERYVYLYACLRDSLAKHPQPLPSCQEEDSTGSGTDSVPPPVGLVQPSPGGR
jgi:hypothetical protein